MVEEKETGGAAVSRGSLTQIPDLGARSGVWNDMGSPALWTHWKRRSYGLTRVVNPDRRRRGGSSGKKRICGLPRNPLPREEKDRSYGLLPRPAISEREAGSGTT